MVRNIVITIFVHGCSKLNPNMVHGIAKATFMLIDWVAVTIGVVWCTKIIMADETKSCVGIGGGRDGPNISAYRTVVLFNLVLAYMYAAILWFMCCLSSCALLAVFKL